MENKKTPTPLFNDCVDILDIIKNSGAEFIEKCNTFRGDLALVDTKSGEQYFVHVFKNHKACKIDYPPINKKPFKDKHDMSAAERREFLDKMLGVVKVID